MKDGTKTIVIPETIDAAISALGALERLLTAKEWERAAIVYAFTRNTRPGERTDLQNNLEVRSCAGFAAIGIQGLRSEPTVTAYRNAWKAAIEAGEASHIEPGDTVILPSMDWPPTGHSHGIADRVKRDAPPDEKAEAIAELLADPLVRQKIKHDPSAIAGLEETIVDIASSSPRLTSRVVMQADERRPVPPVRETRFGENVWGALGVGAAAITRMRDAEKDIERLIAYAHRLGDLSENDHAAFSSIILKLRKSAGMAWEYANQLAEVIGEPALAFHPDEVPADDAMDWISTIERDIVRKATVE